MEIVFWSSQSISVLASLSSRNELYFNFESSVVKWRKHPFTCVCSSQIGQIEVLINKLRLMYSTYMFEMFPHWAVLLLRCWWCTGKRLLLLFPWWENFPVAASEEESLIFAATAEAPPLLLLLPGRQFSPGRWPGWRGWRSWPGASPSSCARSWRSQWRGGRCRRAGRAWWWTTTGRRRTAPPPPSCQSSGASTVWASKSVRRNRQMVIIEYVWRDKRIYTYLHCSLINDRN